MRSIGWIFRHRRTLLWAALIVALVAVFVLGSIGIRDNLAATEAGEYSPSTILFIILQMLSLNWGDRQEPVNGYLEVARALAVFVFLGTILKAVLVFLRRPAEAVCLRHLASRHCIICGLGEKGSRIARQLLERGEIVVVVERNEEISAVGELRDRGAIVFAGDATHPDVLRHVSVHRAARILATCGDDAVNLRVGTAAATLCGASPAGRRRPVIHLQCGDAAAFELLASRAGCQRGGAGRAVELKRFDIPANLARILLASYPLDREPIAPNGARFVRLIVLGRSAEAESVLLHAARQSHHANLALPRIIVIAPDAAAWEQSILFRYPQIRNACQLEFVARDICHPDTSADVERLVAEDEAISTIMLASASDREALAVAARLPPVVAARKVRVFAPLGAVEGLRGTVGDANGCADFVSFDGLRTASTLEAVLQESLDRQAQAMHAAYERKALADKKSPLTAPAMRPWATLAETYRQANRSNADHIAVKLRAVGRVALPTESRRDATAGSFSPEEVEVMARMEHARWCADRWLDGWRHGTQRDDTLKIHPNLVPWEALDEQTRDYDREAIRQIPAMLAVEGKAVDRTAGELSEA